MQVRLAIWRAAGVPRGPAAVRPAIHIANVVGRVGCILRSARREASYKPIRCGGESQLTTTMREITWAVWPSGVVFCVKSLKQRTRDAGLALHWSCCLGGADAGVRHRGLNQRRQRANHSGLIGGCRHSESCGDRAVGGIDRIGADDGEDGEFAGIGWIYLERDFASRVGFGGWLARIAHAIFVFIEADGSELNRVVDHGNRNAGGGSSSRRSGRAVPASPAPASINRQQA